MTTTDLQFLKNLAKHNDRAWFAKHKADFESAQSRFLELVGGLIFALSEYDETLTTVDPRSCLFRIYRDVRFSKDKSPYKSHLAAYICAGGRKSTNLPGYYIHIEPGGESIFGSGFYMPEKDLLDRFRADLDSAQSKIAARLADKKFRKMFPEIVDEDAAKKVPRGYSADHANAELLKLKHFVVHTYLSDTEVCGKSFLPSLAKRGAALHDWNALLMKIARPQTPRRI